MLNNLTGWHFLIILVIVLLLFGAPKLPGLARSLGQSMKIFKSEIKSDEPESQTRGTDAGTSANDSTKTAGPADPNSKS
jgi:sec-independent protein translocase protein TatA